MHSCLSKYLAHSSGIVRYYIYYHHYFILKILEGTEYGQPEKVVDGAEGS